MLVKRGIAAVDGIASGRVVRYCRESGIGEYVQGTEAVERERFLAAIERTRNQIAPMAERDPVFEFHLEMVSDPELRRLVEDAIADGESAVDAVDSARDSLTAMFDDIDDEYLRERRTDVYDVCSRIRANVVQSDGDDAAVILPRSIIVSTTLLPSDMMTMPLECVSGIVTSDGSPTSHICIIARKHGIPVVVGLGEGIDEVLDAGDVIVDGGEGVVIADPDEETISCYSRLESDSVSDSEQVVGPLVTDDGRTILVEANVESSDDVAGAIAAGADGIGLFRSEFLYMSQSDFPSEQYQALCYSSAVRACSGRPLTVRTLDVGGDKSIPYIRFDREMNPSMGLRGIRYTLANPMVFKTQLRALLRASAEGSVRIMFPMVTSVQELRQAKALLEQCKTELGEEGVPFDRSIRVGTMVETPASVFIAPALASECDFFSIGTNDLFQYVMAADRTNASVAYLLQPDDSPVLEAIRLTISAAREAGIECAMCGEMASDPRFTELLLGMGLPVFSVSARCIRKVRRKVASLLHV